MHLFLQYISMMRPIGRLILIVLLAFLTVGCFSPAIIMENNVGCQLVTKKLELIVSEEGTQTLINASLEGLLDSSNCHTPECLLLVPLGVLAISVTSMIVSGSIVVAGNSIHWVEKQGKCENSFTQTVVNNLVKSIQYLDGAIIQTTTDLIWWFKQYLGIESDNPHTIPKYD
jgi:hypothetical protein